MISKLACQHETKVHLCSGTELIRLNQKIYIKGCQAIIIEGDNELTEKSRMITL